MGSTGNKEDAVTRIMCRFGPKPQQIRSHQIAGWAAIGLGILGIFLAPIADKMSPKCFPFPFLNSALYWREASVIALTFIGWLSLEIAYLLEKLKQVELEKKYRPDVE